MAENINKTNITLLNIKKKVPPQIHYGVQYNKSHDRQILIKYFVKNWQNKICFFLHK